MFSHNVKEDFKTPDCPRCNSSDMVEVAFDVLRTIEKGEFWYVLNVRCTRQTCISMILPGLVR